MYVPLWAVSADGGTHSPASFLMAAAFSAPSFSEKKEKPK